MSWADRFSRVVLGLVLVAISPLGLDLLASPVAGWFCLVFGVTNIISSFVGWCFMYSLVGMQSISDAQVEDEDSADAPENLRSLRRKIFQGFGLVTIIVSTLFILEGYSSAERTSYRIELHQQYENLTLIRKELVEHAVEKGYSDGSNQLPDKAMLEHILSHFDSSMLLVVGNEYDVISLSKLLPESDAQLLLQKIVVKKKTPSDKSSLPELKMEKGVVQGDIDQFRLHVSGEDYLWTISNIENLGLWYALVEKSNSGGLALKEVAFRLVTSSFVVIWLGLWGAYAVALFVWTRIERSNRRLVKMAETDELTGLMNERALKQAFDQLIIPGNSDQNSFYVAAVRFRNFHHIVADHGSEMTNQIISRLGGVLRDEIPPPCLLGRLNDGSMVLVTPNGSHGCLDRFRQRVNEIQTVDEFQFSLEPTEIGVVYPDEAENFEILLKDISTLMLRANREKMRFLRYDNAQIESNRVRLRYATQLKEAIETKAFELYLQPKVDLKTGKPVGAETLIRWNHPTDGLLAPAQFLDVIESSNIRSEFARYVATQSVHMLKRLEQQGHKIRIAFNVNGYDLIDVHVMDHLKQLITDQGIEPGRLEIELTEQQTSVNLEKIKDSLRELSECGYSISLDDFGTGMSSLSYCQQLPIDTIKIDRCFVDDVNDDPNTQRIVKTILDLADNFGYSVVAEGIETATAATVLADLNCHVGQGYFFGRPMPYTDFLAHMTVSKGIL